MKLLQKCFPEKHFLAESPFSAYPFAFLKGKKQLVLAILRTTGKWKEQKGRSGATSVRSSGGPEANF